MRGLREHGAEPDDTDHVAIQRRRERILLGAREHLRAFHQCKTLEVAGPPRSGALGCVIPFVRGRGQTLAPDGVGGVENGAESGTLRDGKNCHREEGLYGNL